MIEVFSELHQTEPEVLKQRVGLDEDEFADADIQELLGVYNEVKLGLEDDDDDEDDEEGEEEQEDESDEEAEESNEEDDDMLGSDEEAAQAEPEPAA